MTQITEQTIGEKIHGEPFIVRMLVRLRIKTSNYIEKDGDYDNC